MKRLTILFGILMLTGFLSGCSERDEFGQKYSIDDTDIVQAFENDMNLSSLSVKYIDHDEEDADNSFEVEYKIDSNIGYSEKFDTYYEKVADYVLCTMQYDQLLGDGYVRHGVVNAHYQFISSADNYVSRRLQSRAFDVNEYEIDGEFYKYEIPHISDFYAFVRVNSQNFIDYFKVERVVDGENVLYEEHYLSGHNTTNIVLPESTYLGPLEYDENMVLSKGFTKSILSETETLYTSDSYIASIDFENQAILFTKDDESVLYEGPEDAASVMIFIDEEGFNELFLLLWQYERIESGRYNSCIED